MVERTNPVLVFGPYRLDCSNARLWQGQSRIKLRKKALDVLIYLVRHSRRLVTKKELLESIWRGGHVTPVALRVCIREVRIALADTALPHQYIATEGQLGYQFVAAVEERCGEYPDDVLTPHADTDSDSPVVGRTDEVLQLQRWLAQSLTGRRRFGLIGGEPGIGKTTLVRTFLKGVETGDAAWVGVGQCVEPYGAGEAYRPILEALGRLCRGAHSEQLTRLLYQHAPSWMTQIPGVLSASEYDALRHRVEGLNPQRMLREMAEALEIVSQHRPVVLVLEDLHWSDSSTLELLVLMARRWEPARLLVLATYRPAQILDSEHPFNKTRHELLQKEQCNEIQLSYLSVETVGDYLSKRMAQCEPQAALVELIHRKTNGNPLFMVSTVNALISEGLLQKRSNATSTFWDDKSLADFERSVPAELQQMIEQQLGRLGADDQRLLRIASVAGVEFVTAEVAAGLGATLDEIEDHCEAIALRWPVIQIIGLAEWPDGTVTSRYQFTHALFQNVAYDQLAGGRQSRLHALIALRMEAGYGESVSEVSAELADHFLRAYDRPRAIKHLHQAGRNALQRNAPREAVVYLSRGLSLLQQLPATAERDKQELALLFTLGPVLMTTRGYSAPEVRTNYQRARTLCQRRRESPELFHVWMGLWSYYLVKGELPTALDMAQSILAIATRSGDTGWLLPAHYVMANTLHPMGRAVDSLYHADLGIRYYDPQQHHDLALLYAGDPGVLCHCLRVRSLWTLGRLEAASIDAEHVMALSASLNHAHSCIHALGFTASCYQLSGDLVRVLTHAEKMIVLAEQQSFPFWLAAGRLLRGWVQVRSGLHEAGMVEVRRALVESESTGAGLMRSYYLATYAECCGIAGLVQEGLDAIDQALKHVEYTGERVFEAELYRLNGALLWQETDPASLGSDVVAQIESCLLSARRIARAQKSRTFELRATLDLNRLWSVSAKSVSARKLLMETVADFPEVFSTLEWRQAEPLLEESGLLTPVK